MFILAACSDTPLEPVAAPIVDLSKAGVAPSEPEALDPSRPPVAPEPF